MLPTVYTDALVRAVTPVCPCRLRMGLAFDLPDGQVVRLALNEESVRFLRACLDDYSSSFAGTQSPGSPLISSESMSVPSEGEKV